MTDTYRKYLVIARLIAERARLIRLIKIYPYESYFRERLCSVSRELMRHQTEGEE